MRCYSLHFLDSNLSKILESVVKKAAFKMTWSEHKIVLYIVVRNYSIVCMKCTVLVEDVHSSPRTLFIGKKKKELTKYSKVLAYSSIRIHFRTMFGNTITSLWICSGDYYSLNHVDAVSSAKSTILKFGRPYLRP